jgi:hypothetical protein
VTRGEGICRSKSKAAALGIDVVALDVVVASVEVGSAEVDVVDVVGIAVVVVRGGSVLAIVVGAVAGGATVPKITLRRLIDGTATLSTEFCSPLFPSVVWVGPVFAAAPAVFGVVVFFGVGLCVVDF